MIRPLFPRSPRSVIRTTTDFLFLRLTTRTRLPNGSVGWHAVMAYMSNVSPLAVLRPSNTDPYQDAMPRKSLPCCFGAVCEGVFISGVALLTTGVGVAIGLCSRASACTVRVEMVPKTPVTAKQEVPTSSQNGSGFLGFMLVAFGRISIL